MSLTIQQAADQTRISLSGDMTMHEIEEISEQVKQEWPDVVDVLFDLSEVEDVDIAGVQWMLALKKKILSQQGSLTLTGDCDEWSEVIGILQMDSFFNVPDKLGTE